MTKKKLSHRKKIIILCVTAIFIALSSVYIYFENNFLTVTDHTVTDEKIPQGFDGFIIAQISDFHNTHSLRLQDDILSELKKLNPDIIVITGDFIDTRKTDTVLALSYMEKLMAIAPVYMCTGNHEAASTDIYLSFQQDLLSLGVNILRNEIAVIEKDGQAINITGLDDPLFSSGEDKYRITEDNIDSINYDSSVFTITLSHRPEVFSVYVEKELDLVLSGHAHGGQFRIPFIGGLYTPTEGLFPEYTEDLHEKDGTKMVVSRGIGASVFPIRLNNRPELIVITLCSPQKNTVN